MSLSSRPVGGLAHYVELGRLGLAIAALYVQEHDDILFSIIVQV